MGSEVLPHDVTCAAQARRSVAADLREYRVSADSVDDVMVVLSELVNNAVLHSGAVATGAAAPGLPEHLGLGWHIGDNEVTVCVDDTNPAPPVRRRASNAEPSGRGLALIAAIAIDWGVSAGSPGKRVWARIPVNRT